jgi:hypothetical protein
VGKANYEFLSASNQEAAGAQAPIASQDLLIFNMGGGTLHWMAEASQPWITLDSEEGSGQSSLSIGVDPGGLSTGHYTGTITLKTISELIELGRSQAAASEEAATIEVTLDVLPPKDFGYHIFLPLIMK